MGAAQSNPITPQISAPFSDAHPYILSVPVSNLPLGCACASTDFLKACLQDPASEDAYLTKCEYNMSGDLNGHHWLVLWFSGPEDDEPVAMVVWDADHDAEAKQKGLRMWAELFTPMLDPRQSYLKTRKAVTTVASQPYDYDGVDNGISLLEFAYLALTVQRLYPSLTPPGLPCRWMAHVMFRAIPALLDQPLPAAYIGRIKGVDEGQVNIVVGETRKALAAHQPRGPIDRIECGATVEKKVRERVTLIGLSSSRQRGF
ncbi:hypothetical protein CALVIDRAFT_539895 [Calocera viscosa TUFC12733]|uniref:Uncharacterized protein n=1 Tax=Calocera viscosa (strain TUFC12733) TaxID=1330018 RepID=A0A167JCB8_CALVF|nr:hypothetical protein CALVIDRAFT_539895 [Calocera viscosa TUFC12733]